MQPQPLKCYVATAFCNREQAREAMAQIQAAGHIITHDWTNECAPLGADEAATWAYLEQCGRDDYEGVLSADVLILLAHPEMRDSRAEMGLALGHGIPVMVVDAWRCHSVFYGCPGVQRVADVQHALESATYRVKHLED